jgi:hypothetical protein
MFKGAEASYPAFTACNHNVFYLTRTKNEKNDYQKVFEAIKLYVPYVLYAFASDERVCS